VINKEFVLAGNAIFTVLLSNEEHYTFRVSRPTKDRNGRKLSVKEYEAKPYFIGKLAGPNNLNDYRYLGVLELETFSIKFTAKSNYTLKSDAAVVLQRAFDLLSGKCELNQTNIIDIYHAGHCGRCGRLLTVPSSIESGIGPECAEIMGGASAMKELGIDMKDFMRELV
jgi:hypothetical protein